jgi:phenylalanyl-tRNA synthetase beta chain
LFRPVSKLQPVERDIAVIVSESVTHEALMSAIEEADTQGMLGSATLFDIYRPQAGHSNLKVGEKSLAVRLLLSSDTVTLSEEAIEACVGAVLTSLKNRLDARLRA